MRSLAIFILLFSFVEAQALVLKSKSTIIKVIAKATGCAAEGALQSRSDILKCEGFEASDWWSTGGYVGDGTKSRKIPVIADYVSKTSVISTGCISGNCLKVLCNSWRNGTCGGALAIHWPIPGTQQEVYLRYYIKLAPNYSPADIDRDGVQVDTGGKWPGLADVRTNDDPSGQCGNGGEYSDGINCWSARAKYKGCYSPTNCQANATTRYGFYWYLPGGGDNNQAFGPWDNYAGDGSSGPCINAPGNLAGGTGTDTNSCGKGAAGLLNDRWYLIEQHIKMNTPGVADGIGEGWIDGVLKYQKKNMIFRLVGHDNLHVRTVWLNIHAGGEFVGPAEDTYLVLDQMVVATGAQIGAWKAP